jgi:hypothetical protein
LLLITGWEGRKKVTKLEVQKLIGKLNWAACVIRGGRPFMRRIIDLNCNIRESHHYVRLTLPAKADLAWWGVCLSIFNGTCGFACDAPLPSYCFASDVCYTGGGAFCAQDWFYANWESDFPWVKSRHINEQELFTVFLGLLVL